MHCTLAAVEMLLHDTALSKAETESHLPAALRTEAAARCAATAVRVYDVIVQAKQLEGTEMDAHRQSGEFLIWSIASAITIMRRQQSRGVESENGNTDAIHVLSKALKALVPQDLIPDGVLEEPSSVGGREGSEEEGEGDKTGLLRSCSF